MSDLEPPHEVVEAAARAAYETFSRRLTGADGPKQQAAGRVAWSDESKVFAFVREIWLAVARAALVAAMAKAQEMSATVSPKPDPIDLAKNIGGGAVRCGVGK